MKTVNTNPGSNVKNLTKVVKISNKEIDAQKTKVLEFEKTAKELSKKIASDKVNQTKKEFLYNLGSQDINATTRKALKIREESSKLGLSNEQVAKTVAKTAKEHLKTLPQIYNVQKKNEHFEPFLKNEHFAAVIGCLSFQELFINVINGQMLFNHGKYIDACKNSMLLGDAVRLDMHERGIKVYNLIKAVKFENYDVNEALSQLEILVNTNYDKDDNAPKFTLSQLLYLEKIAPFYHKTAFRGKLKALHFQLAKEAIDNKIKNQEVA